MTMKCAWSLLTGGLLVIVVGLMAWLGSRPGATDDLLTPGANGHPSGAKPFRLALVPERDIFAQRQRYRVLADYLQQQIGRPVKLVTLNTYDGVLEEFEDHHIEGAFLGSMVAVLAHDRCGAQVLAKPQTADGVSSYRGVLFVPDDSPVKTLDDLAGHSLAMVRTTTAANLFPVYLMKEHGLLGAPDQPKFVWVGTHDDVIREVLAGNAEIGAVKDLRLQAYEAENPQVKLRKLAISEPVPNNGLLVCGKLDSVVVGKLQAVLLAMHEDPEGRAALEQFGAERFVPCEIAEYKAIYDMIDRLGPAWDQLGVAGKPPTRPIE